MFSIIHTNENGKVQSMTCKTATERKELANELINHYEQYGPVEGSMFDGGLYMMHTAKGRIRLLFRDHAAQA